MAQLSFRWNGNRLTGFHEGIVRRVFGNTPRNSFKKMLEIWQTPSFSPWHTNNTQSHIGITIIWPLWLIMNIQSVGRISDGSLCLAYLEIRVFPRASVKDRFGSCWTRRRPWCCFGFCISISGGRPVCVLWAVSVSFSQKTDVPDWEKNNYIKSQIIKSNSSKVKAKIWCVHVNRHCTKHHPVSPSFLSFTTHTHTQYTHCCSLQSGKTRTDESSSYTRLLSNVYMYVWVGWRKNKKSGQRLLRLWKRSAGPSCCCGCRGTELVLGWT